jgi:uncharacterized RDD family membrane protein YckC
MSDAHGGADRAEAGDGPPSFPGNAPPPPPGPPSYPTGGSSSSGAPPSSGPRTAATRGGFPPAGGFDDSRPEPAYATWAIRLGGWLIDLVVFLVPLILFFVLFRHTNTLEVHLMARRGTHVRRHISALPFLLTGVLYVIYGTVLCGSSRGQTVGMMAVGVRAVRDDPSLGQLGYGRAFARALFEQVLRLIDLVFFLLGLVWLLDMLFPLWDRKRQTLHDKVAGSVVLRLRPEG